MTYKKLSEAAMPARGDLVDTVLDLLSIDEFAPKTGHDFNIIVVGFHFTEQAAAEDFRLFTERGTAKFKDIEVAPNPDSEGRWLVFVEIERNEEFWETLQFILDELKRLTEQEHPWVVSTYFLDEELPLEMAKPYVVLLSSEYAIKKIKRKNKTIKNEDLNQFFSDSLLESFNVENGLVEFKRGTAKLQFTIDQYDTGGSITESTDNSAIDMGHSVPYEVRVLKNMLGGEYEISNSKNLVYVQNKGQNSLLVLNTYV